VAGDAAVERDAETGAGLPKFEYETRKSWARARRVVAKAKQIDGKQNPRFVVTSLTTEQ
jgi:hypothetical protein